MGHYSDYCSHELDKYWNELAKTCVPCNQMYPIRPGQEYSPNCGLHDDGGTSEGPYRPCRTKTFNNGSFLRCHPCTSCAQNEKRLSECNATTDTQCCRARDQADCVKVALTTMTPTTATTVTQIQEVNQSTTLRVQVSTSILTRTEYLDPGLNYYHLTAGIVLTVFVVLSAYLFYIIKKRSNRGGEFSLKHCLPSNNIPYTNTQSRSSKTATTIIEEVALLQSHTRNLEDFLGPDLQSAPLQMVLDNLDVLEELVILLDPEIPGVKNTSHLASRCSFPATWITYTYSLRDSKSPLRAVLEGVTTKNPEWTVGHLARLLREMDRNDAVAVLSKLNFPKETI
ncbi:IGF-like family receptor 1 [Esox lucius]|uniref:TNFR-Cys domain-containing protein n=1 Tax=Esox lucius TaxID=8010 RepID=A0A3P8Z1D7_ESOLU|nr:IGF-like family receptor 1 [Esox lucius]